MNKVSVQIDETPYRYSTPTKIVKVLTLEQAKYILCYFSEYMVLCADGNRELYVTNYVQAEEFYDNK